jgi:hypothetical protein
MTGDPRFHELLRQIGELHDKKQLDYGADQDPFANVRASERWGIEPWVGALVRLNDKVHRLQQFAKKGELANESAEDSMLDIAVYSLIALILYREAAVSPVGRTHREAMDYRRWQAEQDEHEAVRKAAKEFLTNLEPFAYRFPNSAWNSGYDALVEALRDTEDEELAAREAEYDGDDGEDQDAG